jgi:hypothetical protein
MVTQNDFLSCIPCHQIYGNVEILIPPFRIYLFPVEQLPESIINHPKGVLVGSKLQPRAQSIRHTLWVNENGGTYISGKLPQNTYFGNT